MPEHQDTSSALVDALFERAGVALCLLAPDGTVRRASPRWLQATGVGVGQALADERRARFTTIAPLPVDGGTGWLLTLSDGQRDPGLAATPGAGAAALLAQISEESADVLYAKDRGGRLLFANPATLALVGKRLEEVLGRTDAEFLEDAAAARAVMENDQRIMSSGRAEEVEERVPLPDGSERIWLSRKSPARDARGEVIGLVGISRDITQRRRADSEREQLSHHLRLALDAAQLGWWHYDPETRLARYDERYTRIFGVSGSERDNEELLRLLHPDDLPGVWAAVEAALDPRHPRPYAAEYRIRRPDGQVRWIEAHGAATFAGEGPARRATSLVGTVADITERKLAEEALRAGERTLRRTLDRLRVHVESTPLAVVEWDADYRVIGYSARAQELFGWAPGEVLGKRIDEIPWVPEEDWPAVRAIMRDMSSGARPTNVNVNRNRRRDGSLLWCEWYNSSLHAEDGRLQSVLSFVLDVTERRQAEEALRAANERLREADRRKDEFLGMLSHELRNPLAPIRNSTHILRHAPPGSAQAGRAQQVIERQTEHLTRLVDDLLDVTRVARGKIELRRSRADLCEVVRRAGEDFRLLLDGRGVDLVVALPGGPVWAELDETRITQVIGNLLTNAGKFTGRGDEARLALAASDGEAVITVRDTGAGIAPDLLPSIFEPFVQGERTLARSEGGLGLGLALVKGLVALHGGTVAVESPGPGQGATFTVRLPLAPAAGATPGAPAHPAARGGSRRVLVVDDNRDAAGSLADLVQLLGHEAQVAHDGPSALAAARSSRPDVILCDLGLPGMDGYDVARALRAAGLGGVQLVAVSGYAQPEDVRRAVEAGFDAHLAKPPDPAAIARLLA